jgi:hypothetical protein
VTATASETSGWRPSRDHRMRLAVLAAWRPATLGPVSLALAHPAPGGERRRVSLAWQAASRDLARTRCGNPSRIPPAARWPRRGGAGRWPASAWARSSCRRRPRRGACRPRRSVAGSRSSRPRRPGPRRPDARHGVHLSIILVTRPARPVLGGVGPDIWPEHPRRTCPAGPAPAPPRQHQIAPVVTRRPVSRHPSPA